MAETTADVRRDIEMTRERMSDTIAQLERKVNVAQIVRDHPWPAVGVAVGAGFLLANSKADVKAAAATVAATGGASSKLGRLLDDLSARLIEGLTTAFNERVDTWVDDLKGAIGAPNGLSAGTSGSSSSRTASAAHGDGQTLGYGDARQGGTGARLGSDQPSQQSGGTSSALAH